MGLSEEELLALYFGGLFHDAGKGVLTDFSGWWRTAVSITMRDLTDLVIRGA